MIDIKNINHHPNIDELSDYIDNALFNTFYQYLVNEYQVICKIEYSKDALLRGWNIKVRKAGKSLCVIYPKNKFFTVLIVIGNAEKERVEQLLLSFSDEVRKIYRDTLEGNGQRWLMIDLHTDINVYRDMLELIRIRRFPA